MELSLLADVGGTNSRVALAQGGRVLEESVARFANAGRSGLAEILGDYVRARGVAVGGVCVAIAGPVSEGVARMTNLDWEIRAQDLLAATGAARAHILNDLQAQAYALAPLAEAGEGLAPLVAGERRAGAATLVIGLGTGVNAAPVHRDAQGRRFIAASESGHITLPARDAGELALVQDLRARTGSGSIEEALSGRGVVQVHQHLHGVSDLDAAAIIAAMAQGEAAALATGRVLARLLGAYVGDLALVHLPFGGIYLCGSVARGLAPHLLTLGFLEALRDKGRFSEFMAQFSVGVVTDDFAALTGCAAYLRE